MKYDPEKHHRRSIRLKGHDYAGGGLYFVTLCAHRELVAWAKGMPFGAAIIPPEQIPPVRELMEMEMQKTARLLPWMEWGEWVIMPDHFHALIKIDGGQGCLGDVITGFKAGVTRTLHARGDILVARNGTPAPEHMRIWHRNYYEVIVRSAEAEEKIAEYIRMNPWKCVQQFGNGLRGIGNPSLWNGEKLGVLCSRNAPHIGRIPDAEVYFGGWHSPKEKEILEWLLEKKKRVIACPAWRIDCMRIPEAWLPALESNRMLILEMSHLEGNIVAAKERNQFVIESADRLFIPHVTSGGMLGRLLKEQKTRI